MFLNGQKKMFHEMMIFNKYTNISDYPVVTGFNILNADKNYTLSMGTIFNWME